MAQDPKTLIWLDMEMTGLEPDRDRIIEIAIVLTDEALEVIAEAPREGAAVFAAVFPRQ